MAEEPTLEEIRKMDDKEKEEYRTKSEVYSRIVGYLRPVEQWNDGKQEEFENREEFEIKSF